jgi:hypothetical protein
MNKDFDKVMNKKCEEFFAIELKEENKNRIINNDL